MELVLIFNDLSLSFADSKSQQVALIGFDFLLAVTIERPLCSVSSSDLLLQVYSVIKILCATEGSFSGCNFNGLCQYQLKNQFYTVHS